MDWQCTQAYLRQQGSKLASVQLTSSETWLLQVFNANNRSLVQHTHAPFDQRCTWCDQTAAEKGVRVLLKCGQCKVRLLPVLVLERRTHLPLWCCSLQRIVLGLQGELLCSIAFS